MQDSSTVAWQCPSNIALVKYWGKHGRQLPRNPSISLTLDNAHTKMYVTYNYSQTPLDSLKLSFLFDGKEQSAFKEKIHRFLLSIADDFPLINHLELHIESTNSFPHSSGIASSASSMSALAMCLLDIEKEILNKEHLDINKASHLARLGSGSASRSVHPYIAIWGKHKDIFASSDEYAIPYYERLHPVFQTFHDDILIISDREKAVSSRAGHALMENNPYAPARFNEANMNLMDIIEAMEKGDLEVFGNILESEALTLHALMMSSKPPYILMEPNSLAGIKMIQEFRSSTRTPVYFTLDAGPNIHLLYPHEYLTQVNQLKSDLRSLCHEGRIIEDQVGKGPLKIL